MASLLLVLGWVPIRLGAQEPPQQWAFRSVPSADLLFHGLAVVGFQGFSSLPLYDRGYADQVRVAKEARGIYPTRLDRESGRFRQAFESDSTFELLHFLPLYFGSAQPATVLETLSAVAGGRGTQSAASDVAFGASVVNAVFQRAAQRQVLGEFTKALEEEWNVFLREYLGETSGQRDAVLDRASRRWNGQVAGAISDFLDARQMTGVLVMVSGALGPEGRVFAGDPENSNDNLFAVSFAHSETGLGIAAFLLKELYYPVASGVVDQLGLSRDRVGVELLSGRLAVRCGAELLDGGASGLADAYRATFLAAAAASGVRGVTLEAAYPLDASVLERLRRALRDARR